MQKAHKQKSVPIQPDESTPESVYLSRRKFLKAMGVQGAGALLTAACSPDTNNSVETALQSSVQTTPENLEDVMTSYEAITHYNNYYEFTTSKEDVAELAQDFKVKPWQVEVFGLVEEPLTLSLEEIMAFPQEERIYHMRCVEGWSMVIPWNGFPLAALLEKVQPTPEAKYVRFETIFDPDQMPGQKRRSYPWPYQEGLRLDEAMHDFTLLATGIYGKPLTNQSGAPVRLVVPWKYGFKSIKSIVKIELVADQPSTLWNNIASNEYGFYANVNPNVPHPRWSQASERRIGETIRRPTLMFNGYAEEVGYLYEGMDLTVDF